MDAKETLKDIGRQIIGQGAEVRFKNDVLEHERTSGVSHEQAVKDLFLDRLGNVQLELDTNGLIDGNSKDYKAFQGALNELFSGDVLDQFRKDGADPGVFQSISVPPSNATDIDRTRSHFSENFEGNVPSAGVLKDYSDNMILLNSLMQRVAADPRLGGMDSLENIIAANPELGADIGKILDAKRAVERHERHFGKDLNFEHAMSELKKTAQCSITEMIWQAPADFTVAILKKGFSPNKKGQEGFVSAFLRETAKFAGREVWAGTKFLTKAAYATGSLIKNKLIR